MIQKNSQVNRRQSLNGTDVREDSLPASKDREIDKDKIINGIEAGFEKFAKGLSNIFEDITSLEVNTMIVSEIRGMKFYPEEAYWFIYN
ncbi:MAG: hypothetical protein ACRDEA_16920, partial [Microcystaceae cyanobacterium]